MVYVIRNAIDTNTLTLASVNPVTRSCTSSLDDAYRVPVLFGLDTVPFFIPTSCNLQVFLLDERLFHVP